MFYKLVHTYAAGSDRADNTRHSLAGALQSPRPSKPQTKGQKDEAFWAMPKPDEGRRALRWLRADSKR